MFARHRLLLPATAILLGLAACGSSQPPAPPSSSPGSATSVPSSAAPATSPVVASGASCPSAKTLEKLADLPKDWHFVPSGVECWKDWATADPEGPTPGDGVYLFQYKTGTGWSYHSQGSGYHCKDLGINETTPFCQYP